MTQKPRQMNETPETMRSDYCAVLTEHGPILLREWPTIGREGVLVGVEPDGNKIYIREWSKVWKPTTARLKHMAVGLPARQREILSGGVSDDGPEGELER